MPSKGLHLAGQFQRSIRLRLGLTFASVCAIFLPAYAQTNTCTPSFERFFRVVSSEALGIWAIDGAPVIGPAVADEKFHVAWINALAHLPGWYPVDGTKRVLCGKLERWLLYRSVPPELDLHPYIAPSRSFEGMLEYLPPYATTEGGAPHIYGEVTPPEWFADFWKRPGADPVRGDNKCGSDEPACIANAWFGQTACIYAPWIMERIYDYRVEMHPVQLMWGGTDDDGVRVYSLEDSSLRFTDANEYRLRGAASMWPRWNKANGPIVWIGVETTLGSSKTLSVLRNPMSGNSSAKPVTSRLSLDGSSIEVSYSGDLHVGAGESCRSSAGTNLTFVGVSASPNAPEIRALDVKGASKSPSPSTPAHLDSASTPEAGEDTAHAVPTVAMRGVEWAQGSPDIDVKTHLTKTRAEWGFGVWGTGNEALVGWSAMPQQRLLVNVSEKGASAGSPLLTVNRTEITGGRIM